MKSETGDDEAIKLLKNRFLFKMPKRYRVTEYHVIATFLCPKYRKFKFSNGQLVSSAMSKLKELLREWSESDEDSYQNKPNENMSSGNSIFDQYMEINSADINDSEIERYHRPECNFSASESAPESEVKMFSERSAKQHLLSTNGTNEMALSSLKLIIIQKLQEPITSGKQINH